MPLYFVSSNRQKHADVARIFADSKRPLRILDRELVEILSSKLDDVVKAKAKAAYRATMVPVLVEHGALYIDYLKEFPGPMVKLFWQKLGDHLPTLIPSGVPRTARVKQMVCYCDEKRLHVYSGEVTGVIAPERLGSAGIHWDSMFIPDGHTKTLGEMGADERIAAHAFGKAYAAMRADHGI
jgi:non-canonical purine NTP pyrophosphatase (RdgB/HAM1 family)